MKSEAVSFPAVTLCNFRSLDFDVINRLNQFLTVGHQAPGDTGHQDYGSVEDTEDYAATEHGEDEYPEYVDSVFKPTDRFMFEYMKYVANLSSILVSNHSDPVVRFAKQVYAHNVLG